MALGAGTVLSVVPYVQGDAAGALQQLREAAALGDPYATFNLGYMHMRGMGTPPNATAARANFEIAARHGIAPAYNGLGVLHYEGQAGAPIDYAAARQAFETGAAFGDPDAMFNLATMHAGTHLDFCLYQKPYLGCICPCSFVCQAITTAYCHCGQFGSRHTWCRFAVRRGTLHI